MTLLVTHTYGPHLCYLSSVFFHPLGCVAIVSRHTALPKKRKICTFTIIFWKHLTLRFVLSLCFQGVPEQKLRGHLGSFGITGNLALQPMYTLSGMFLAFWAPFYASFFGHYMLVACQMRWEVLILYTLLTEIFTSLCCLICKCSVAHKIRWWLCEFS